ncbi:macrolide family glycosyltransferase [Streptomyces laurentii]|uniref:macrolide family glycosyltransferase n=1 Tax=Streptomyces laurentii TaxID=39478 RepID=UPI0036CFD0F9
MASSRAHPRRHIAVFNVPQHGHVNPTLAVVSELVGRGWRVSYATTEAFAPQVRAAGATPVLHRDLHQGVEAPEDMAEGARQAAEQAIGTAPELSAAFASDRPDAVLYDVYAWAGAMLAAAWRVPSIRLSPTYLPFQGMTEEFYGHQDVSRIPGFPRLAAALASHGIADPAAFLMAPGKAIAFFPEAFQYRPDTVLVPDRSFVGPALADRSFQGDWQPPKDGRPVLLVSLGSQFNRRPDFYRACVAAFRDLPLHVVMSLGDVAPGELGPLPDAIETHATVPQLSVLPHAHAFVTHGGMGSVMESLAHGVPMVAVPQMAEQRVNADQIARLGLGVHLPREHADADALREAVRHVSTSHALRERVDAMRRTVLDAGGAPAAADAIEKYLIDEAGPAV